MSVVSEELSDAVVEGSSLQGQTAGKSAGTSEAESELAALQAKLEATEQKLQEAEEAVAYERARASAASARVDREKLKAELVSTELARTQAKLEEALKLAQQVQRDADEERADGWDDGLDDEEPSPVGSPRGKTVTPPQNGAEALERLKAQQRQQQQQKEQEAMANDPNWRARLQQPRGQSIDSEGPIWCAGVRDCGGRKPLR